jgi:hypothetical protein
MIVKNTKQPGQGWAVGLEWLIDGLVDDHKSQYVKKGEAGGIQRKMRRLPLA